MHQWKPAGLILLCALALCASQAASASAAWQPATNVTAYTCVKGGGNLDFSDAHCDTQVTKGTGAYGHVAITEKIGIEVSNKETRKNTTEAEPLVFTSQGAGIPVQITCKKAEPGTGEPPASSLQNVGTGTTHQVEGTLELELSECIVNQPNNCSVEEPIKVNSIIRAVEEPGEKTMGLEYRPDPEGGAFMAVTFQGAKCAALLFNPSAKFSGSAIATGGTGLGAKYQGATGFFTTTMTKQTLSFWTGEPATLTGALTIRKAGGGPAIAFTTPT